LLAAVPVMDALVLKARLDAVLTTMFGTKVVDIHRASVDPTLRLSYGRGRPRPLFRGAAPKVILANMARPQLVRTYAAAPAEAAASGLGGSWAEFRACLSEIRRRDFYWSRGELESSVAGAAVPIFDTEGEVAAALALVGLSATLEEVGEAPLRALLLQARAEIHARIAQAGPPATLSVA